MSNRSPAPADALVANLLLVGRIALERRAEAQELAEQAELDAFHDEQRRRADRDRYGVTRTVGLMHAIDSGELA